jgi:hypothetical protein
MRLNNAAEAVGRTVAIAAALAVAPLAGGAQQAPPEPSQRIAGTIADFHGKYVVVVRTAAGSLSTVVLHQGTIINPTGLRLERGMPVLLSGHAERGAFAVAQVDTPFATRPRTGRPWSEFGFDGADAAQGPGNQPPLDRWWGGPVHLPGSEPP